ncbi:MAG TPA: GTPase HflX [Polyangiaceae bacterium]|jgi:GTP-binding protein HflX|nr:GTPase HflX [Polyangiaceae bacterium]
MPELYGNTTGLSPNAIKTLERIYRRRVPSDRIATPELVRSLADASRESRRQVGALVHRSGQVDYVVVGHATGLMLPDIGRLRAAEGRFRALRLVHTHLFNEPLTKDDLVDLTRLRLDLVSAILLNPASEPQRMSYAYNVPTFEGKGTPYSIVGPVPYGQQEPNFAELIASLEAEFAQHERTRAVAAKDGRAILIHVGDKRKGGMQRAKSRLSELTSLALTAGVDVADTIIQLRDQPDPKFVIGAGKLEDVVMRAIDLDAETLIFDCDLNPAQAHGIAGKTDLKVLDRSQLILDIFAQRAETRDGKLQVELAQLKYTLPRLGTKDDSLSRLTGGIGGRGPGETTLEIGRRRARDRINRLEKELKNLERQRSERRRRRAQSDVPVVAIVGYTNAGKSTLLNTLTDAGVLAEDKLFATLDTRARKLMLPDGKHVVLTDTVGFIREMPKDLFAAFRATFEEASEADLILEVVDASDPEQEEHLATTSKILTGLDLERTARLRVYNKMDRVPAEERAGFEAELGAVCISALDKTTTLTLLVRVAEELSKALSERAREAREAEQYAAFAENELSL